MSQDTSTQQGQALDNELDTFIVVTSDKPQDAAPQPEPKADEQKPVEGPGSAPEKTSQEPEDKHEARLQRRFDRLTRRAGDAERRADAAEQELASLKANQTAGQTSQDKEPDIMDFETWDAWDDAHKEWEGKQAKPAAKTVEKPEEKPKEQQNAPAAMSEELKQAFTAMTPSFDAARQAHTDFDQLIGANDLAITEDMVNLIAETDNPGEVAYWLGSNKEEAKRIAGLSPMKQVKAISDIESKLNQTTPPKRISNAPPPISPLSGNESDKQGYHPAMTQSEFEEWDHRENAKGQGGWL